MRAPPPGPSGGASGGGLSPAEGGRRRDQDPGRTQVPDSWLELPIPSPVTCWPKLDFLFLKGCFHTNFNITAPEFLLSAEMLGYISNGRLSCETAWTVQQQLKASKLLQGNFLVWAFCINLS